MCKIIRVVRIVIVLVHTAIVSAQLLLSPNSAPSTVSRWRLSSLPTPRYITSKSRLPTSHNCLPGQRQPSKWPRHRSRQAEAILTPRLSRDNALTPLCDPGLRLKLRRLDCADRAGFWRSCCFRCGLFVGLEEVHEISSSAGAGTWVVEVSLRHEGYWKGSTC
ncbi:hypothetical protein CLAFUW4_20109 [Fulvia fulva]|uniref:uncharacterized protein n=1 Tax=Passalora fulva TaxID=5499 RepID=UPI0028529992|nr:uncharacterized protein CLAFUR5_20109 [Fulvia fulva]KAK4610143.1 hypothetical protein CLAFUR4_20109 [Fulvia fulva]KAK4611194.1 hypothetical protein CLAFUR0_20109 [Fulvia fulva]WMI39088.1 hypothetical protein CLAFUR5_20109 [Fulvia fulva]WPV22359.1 hypothetical protein CLAFUW4_20109 [Fulvia fulva]WPV36686.1 hypothetical protein CLAFUW7_20109 [Fulvia fulva]